MDIVVLITFSGLAKVAIFTTNVDAENQTLFNHKCVCGALNRHFCQTRVMPSFSHLNLKSLVGINALSEIDVSGFRNTYLKSWNTKFIS